MPHSLKFPKKEIYLIRKCEESGFWEDAYHWMYISFLGNDIGVMKQGCEK